MSRATMVCVVVALLVAVVVPAGWLTARQYQYGAQGVTVSVCAGPGRVDTAGHTIMLTPDEQAVYAACVTNRQPSVWAFTPTGMVGFDAWTFVDPPAPTPSPLPVVVFPDQEHLNVAQGGSWPWGVVTGILVATALGAGCWLAVSARWARSVREAIWLGWLGVLLPAGLLWPAALTVPDVPVLAGQTVQVIHASIGRCAADQKASVDMVRRVAVGVAHPLGFAYCLERSGHQVDHQLGPNGMSLIQVDRAITIAVP